MLGWYFARGDEKLGYGDGRKVAIGVTHTVEGPVELCSNGLHASEKIIDALQYASSNILYRVELSGVIEHGADKSCATKREYLYRIDIGEILRKFAYERALNVAHLWDAPQIVLDYLGSGNEGLRAAANDAANDAAWDAAWTAAWAAAWAAADDAANDAAWDAAWAAANDAANDAAWDAAWDTASDKLTELVLTKIAGGK